MRKPISLLFLLVSFLISGYSSSGQDLLSDIPKTKEEFIASEKKVLATIDWLETSPIDQEKEMRKQQSAFLLAWITNSPTVTLELHAGVLDFSKKNPDLLIIFMGGWTRYSLQNNYSKDNFQGTLAGLKSVIKVYKGQSMKKDKEMEKLIEADNKGELEKWVNEKMKTK